MRGTLNLHRDLKAYVWRKAGASFFEIAKEIGVSRERVRQIVFRMERRVKSRALIIRRVA